MQHKYKSHKPNIPPDNPNEKRNFAWARLEIDIDEMILLPHKIQYFPKPLLLQNTKITEYIC